MAKKKGKKNRQGNLLQNRSILRITYGIALLFLALNFICRVFYTDTGTGGDQ